MTRGLPGTIALLGMAASSGGALVLAFPPYDLWPLAMLSPAVLCWMAAQPRLTASRILQVGLMFGGVFWLGTLYWIASVMLRYGQLSWPSSISVLVLLVGYLSLFPAAFCASVHSLARHRGRGYALVAAPLVWAGLELLRNYLFTGVPWARLGTALHSSPGLLQIASLTGVYGLSAVCIAVAAGLAWVVGPRKGPSHAGWIGIACVLILLVGALLWGRWRIREIHLQGELAEGWTGVASVQGNIAQDLKWDREMAELILDRHARLTRDGAQRGAELLVWPESSMPLAVRRNEALGERLQGLARETEASLLVGSLDWRADEDGRTRVFNSAFLIGPDGRVADRYDKVHLLPFGEYVPLRDLLFFVSSLVEEVGQLRPGLELAPVRGEATPVLGVQICYEIAFPELARSLSRQGAEVLVNITNDAWFGNSSAPYQHFAEAKMRAVETGKWLVRSANTGISGIVSPTGTVVERSALGEVALVQGRILPSRRLSPYVRFGDVFAWTCAILAAIALLWARFSSSARHVPPRTSREVPAPDGAGFP